LLEDMLPYYDRLAGQTGKAAEVHRKTAAANRRVGDIRQRLGQYDLAAVAYKRAIDLYDELARQSLDSLSPTVEIARICNELGCTYRLGRRADDARQSHSKALAILKPIAGDTAVPVLRYELSRTYYFLGVRDRAEPHAKTPGRRDRGPRGRDQGERGPRRGTGRERRTPATRPGAHEYVRKAIAILTDLTVRHPTNMKYRYLLAACYRSSFARVVNRDPEAAMAELDKAAEILEQLIREAPRLPEFRYEFAEVYAAVDMRHKLPPGMSYADAEQRLGKALQTVNALVAEHPYVPRYLISQAHTHHKLGIVLERARKHDAAEQSRRQAVAIYDSLAKRFPEAPSYRIWLGSFRHALAKLLLRRDKLTEARSLLEETASELSKLLKIQPKLWYIHGLLDQCYATLGDVHRERGDRNLADEAKRTARHHREMMRLFRFP